MANLDPTINFDGFVLQIVGECLKESMGAGIWIEPKGLASEVTEALLLSREKLRSASNTSL